MVYQDLEIEARQRRDEIAANRSERLRKQRERRELDTVRFIRSMKLLENGVDTWHPQCTAPSPSYRGDDDHGIQAYRMKNKQSIGDKAKELEIKLGYRYVRSVIVWTK